MGAALSRRARPLHLSDLGGEDNCSEAEKSIARRAALLTVELERLETLFAQAGEATASQLALYSTTSNTLRRLLQTIGVERRAKPVPDLYLDVLPALATKRDARDGVGDDPD